MDFNLDKLVRKNIKALKPYSSARDEFKGNASVFLDANENGYGSPLDDDFNRYPDPLQWDLKLAIAQIKGVPAKNIFVGNGSDEVIDLSFRIFCNPGKDNVIICPPTYGMYEVSANVNDVKVNKVNLLHGFQLDVEAILNVIDDNTKLIFICSPNNPTGNNMLRQDIEAILNNFSGMVIIDEAYVNFSKHKTLISALTEYPNLLVMQTLSKAWGLAALRIGLAFSSLDVISLYNKIKAPYNINLASQLLALDALHNSRQVNGWISEIVNERNRIAAQVSTLPFVFDVYESEANFILVKVNNADKLYQFLTSKKIIVRNRSKEVLCENCLRFTIGTPYENNILLDTLKSYK